MMGKCKRRHGETIGHWALLRCLGSGGNAEVWLAKRKDGAEAALKILNQRNPSTEPYRRFTAEIEVLKRLGSYPGVLPLIDSDLPKQPLPARPAWLAMPVAEPVRKALGGQPLLSQVVEAVAMLSRTLAVLARDHQIYHRDLKPENLYRYQEEWCLGDFGLVDFPDKESLTAPGHWVGPKYYLAPELLADPDHAENGPADVYSLAKTLWVLATGQNYPLAGFLPRYMPQFRISTYNAGDRAYILDDLVERATHPEPSERPRMGDFADELQAWLEHPYHPASLADLSEIRAKIEPTMQAHLRAAAAQEDCQRWVEAKLTAAQGDMRVLAELLSAATGLQATEGNQATVGNLPEIGALTRLPDRLKFGESSFGVQSPTRIGRGNNFVGLAGSLVVIQLKNATVHIGGGWVLSLGAGEFTEVWCETYHCTPGTAIAEKRVASLTRSLAEHLPDAVLAFGRELSSRSPI